MRSDPAKVVSQFTFIAGQSKMGGDAVTKAMKDVGDTRIGR